MISANEIRIGNYVSLKCGTHVPIADGGILAISQKRFECYPIPLTPEILEKCGFQRHKCGISGADMWQGMDGWSIDNPFFSGWLFRGDGYMLRLVGYYNSEIYFLHQLQNLYWCLCGKELEINLQ